MVPLCIVLCPGSAYSWLVKQQIYAATAAAKPAEYYLIRLEGKKKDMEKEKRESKCEVRNDYGQTNNTYIHLTTTAAAAATDSFFLWLVILV